jgi:hypothetical protein
MSQTSLATKEAFGMLCITVMVVVAICHSVDGNIIISSIAGIAGIAGFQLFSNLTPPWVKP